jgi:hypothetical protein
MSSLNKAIPTSLAVVATCAALFAGSAPAQAHDGRNAALIGGLIAGAIIAGALSQAQADEAAPVYHSNYYRHPAYDGYYAAAPRYRYRDYHPDYWGNGGGIYHDTP